MQQQRVWRWVFRDPVGRQIRTEGRMPGREATPYPGATRLPAIVCGPHHPDERNDFEDTQAGSFHATGAYAD